MLLFILSLLILPIASAQQLYTIESTNSLCNRTFDDANATGIYSFNPDISRQLYISNPDSAPPIPDVSWAVTLYENETSEQYALWYSTGGANYSDNFALRYDVCSIIVYNTTAEATYRGAQDNGTCLSAFDTECVDALNRLGASTADSLVSEPTTYLPTTNLTGSALSTVCQGIGRTVQDNLPQECQKYYNSTVAMVPTPMTNITHNVSALYSDGNCAINDSFRGIVTLPVYEVSNATYDLLAHDLVPILTIFMPIANVERPVNFISHSQLTCVHIDHFNEGSRVAAPAARPRTQRHLSKGAKAGIVIGVVVGVAAIAELIWWLWRRHQKRRKDAAQSPLSSADDKGMAEMSPDTVRVELPYDAAPKHELDSAGTEVVEMPVNGTTAVYEKDGQSETAELPGTIPVSMVQGTKR